MSEATFIVIRPDLMIGTHKFQEAELFDRTKILHSGQLNEDHMKMLKDQRYFVELSHEAFEQAYRRRPGGSDLIPLGFTEEFLRKGGYFLGETATPPKAKREPKNPPHRATRPTPESFTRATAEESYKGKLLHPTSRGKLPPIWHVTDPIGTRLRDKGFNKIENARAFVDELEAKALAQSPLADNPVIAKESEHDDHVRSNAVDGQG